MSADPKDRMHGGRGLSCARRIARDLLGAASVVVFAAQGASADFGDNLFRAQYEIGTQTDLQRGTNDLTQLDRLFDGNALEDITDGLYDPLTDRVLAQLDLRGVEALTGFEQDSTAFYFRVEAAGIDVVFDAGDRDQSVEEFQRWLKGDLDTPSSSAEALTSLLQAFVAESAVDPVAGNPFSLQTRMMQATYDDAARLAFRPVDEFQPDDEGRVWTGEDVFSLGADFAPFWGGVWNGFVADITLDYVLNLKEPRLAVVFDMPIAYTRTEAEAHTVSAHAGVGVLYRAKPWWNILTQGRVGITGSIQLGGLAVLYSTGLTSQMQWQLGETTLRLGNGFSASSSIDGIEWLGYELTYGIDNYLVRNGFEVERPLPARLRGRPLFARLSFSDNWILGSEVFTDHFNEVGLHLGTTRSLGSGAVRDRSSLGLTYSGAPDYHALRLSFDYAF